MKNFTGGRFASDRGVDEKAIVGLGIFMNKKGLTCSLVCFLVSACAGLAPTATETYMVADCIATAKVFTWEDINGDGIQDEGEPPMPFVTTSIGYPDALTDSDGWGTPSEFEYGCKPPGRVSVKVPPGYKPTTPTHYEMTGNDEKYYFGFYPEDTNAIGYFPNEPEWQKAFINRGTKVIAFHYSDGVLEITIDRNGTTPDDYYDESTLTDDGFYFDFFILDVISDLYYQHNIMIIRTQITLIPSKTVFSCLTGVISEWDMQISGYEILTQHCDHKQ